jgi:hypothetical protein
MRSCLLRLYNITLTFLVAASHLKSLVDKLERSFTSKYFLRKGARARLDNTPLCCTFHTLTESHKSYECSNVHN